MENGRTQYHARYHMRKKLKRSVDAGAISVNDSQSINEALNSFDGDASTSTISSNDTTRPRQVPGKESEESLMFSDMSNGSQESEDGEGNAGEGSEVGEDSTEEESEDGEGNAGEGSEVGEDSTEEESEAGEGNAEEEADDTLNNDQDSADDSDEDDQGSDIYNDTPIYHGARISVAEHIISVLLFITTYNITGAALSDLLVLISLHCLAPNLCKTSKYIFKKIVSSGTAPVIRHYFCSVCMTLLPIKSAECPNCQKVTNKSYFLEIPIMAQISSLFKRRGFFEDLQHRFNRRKDAPDAIEDIYDGDVYQTHFGDRGFLRNPNNVSLMWYTDGVKIFKSSKFSVWPVYFAINELPYKKRYLQQNIILAGLWFGSDKPAPNLFMKCIYDSMKMFRQQGFHVNIPLDNSLIHVKGMVLCGTCDLPAKSLFLNSMQFNGAFGCFRCKAEGMQYKLGPRSQVRVYPSNINSELRNHDETVSFAAVAHQSRPVLGIKGPSIIALLVSDVIKSTAVDVMHGVYLGVVRKLLELWFDPKFSTQIFSLSKMVHLVDQRLLMIKPPSFVQRVPRSIKQHLVHWKAHELKAWFFYYSIPVLTGILDDEYLENYALLVSSIYFLNAPSILPRTITKCTKNLTTFLKNFEKLYGLRFLTLNFHQLIHLPEVVTNLGPLWVTSCFPFEDKNGQITRFVHGTQHAQLQICTATNIFMMLPSMFNLLSNRSLIKDLCSNLTFKGKKNKIVEEIGEDTYALGAYVYCNRISPDIRAAMRRESIGTTGACQTFYRLRKKGVEYSCISYNRTIRKMSSCVSFKLHGNNCIGQVVQYLRVSDCLCRKSCLCTPANYYAVISLLEDDERINSFIKKIKTTSQLRIVRTNALITLLFWIETLIGNYVGFPVNFMEYE